MTQEELEEYKHTLELYIDSAQDEYRRKHPSCFYCECAANGEWSWDYTCRITNKFFNLTFDQSKAKLTARFCKYYFPKTDLSNS